jgi:hypothetical protein
MEIIITVIGIATWFSGVSLIKNTTKTIQIVSNILLLIMSIGLFIVFRQRSPEQFANVFLTPQYAVMAIGIALAQIGSVPLIKHLMPNNEDLELTPLRVMMLALFANIILAVVMAITNGLMLVK